MKRMMSLLVFLMAVNTAFADRASLNETVVRIINQINAILPLLDEAKDEIEPNARVTLQVEHFIGPDGKAHPGVREDLLSIRDSLIEFVNEPVIAPKTIKPLALDYVGRG